MFCKACGLRRHEVAQLCTQDVYRDKNGRVIVHVRQGKGGKERFVAALTDMPLILAQQAAAEVRKYTFPHIPKYAPVHEWRAVYARELYKKLERPLDEIPQKERYICRKERAGIIYDKCAMQTVSYMLGHARLDVVTSYL